MTGAEVSELVRLILTALLIANIVAAIITLFLERRDPSSLWAWILIMFFLPVVGFGLYVFIGRRPRRSKATNLL